MWVRFAVVCVVSDRGCRGAEHSNTRCLLHGRDPAYQGRRQQVLLTDSPSMTTLKFVSADYEAADSSVRVKGVTFISRDRVWQRSFCASVSTRTKARSVMERSPSWCLKKFGLLDQGFSPAAVSGLSLLTEQIAGYYDDKTQTDEPARLARS